MFAVFSAGFFFHFCLLLFFFHRKSAVSSAFCADIMEKVA